LKTIKKRCSNF